MPPTFWSGSAWRWTGYRTTSSSPRTAPASSALSYKDILRAIGSKGDLTSKVRESLVSIGRLLLFLANEAEGMRWNKDVRLQLQAMQRDVLSLSDHATYLVEQDHLPARCHAGRGADRAEQHHQDLLGRRRGAAAADLIASIYGMNFKHMPELEWEFGYPYGDRLMMLAAILPYYFFKWRKWL